MPVRNTYRLISLAMLVIAAGGNLRAQSPDLASLSDSDLKSLTVRMERKGCLGRCSAYTVIIHGDGRVEYEGKQDVKVKGARQGKTDQATIKWLIGVLADAKFMTIADDYSANDCHCRRFCTDMPSAVTEVSVGSASHRIWHYYGCTCAPESLSDLEAAIDAAGKTRRWVGNKDRGPDGTSCRDKRAAEN